MNTTSEPTESKTVQKKTKPRKSYPISPNQITYSLGQIPVLTGHLVSIRKAQELIAEGKLTKVKVGKQTGVFATELHALLAERAIRYADPEAAVKAILAKHA